MLLASKKSSLKHNYAHMKIVGKITSFKTHEFTPENLPTGVRPIASGMLRLCRSIDSTYPVLGAMRESPHSISASSVGIVVSQEGRPNSFSRTKEFGSDSPA